jgi:DNA-binding MarR family transcriptional regulator
MSEPEYDSVEVARAARRLDLALAEMHLDVAHRMEMTPAELLALAHLAVDDGLSPGELSRRLHMRTGAVTALLDRLTDHGHVTREAHPTDRRKVVVRLTKAGRREAMRHLGPMVSNVIALVRGLPQEDRETIGRFIDELAVLVAERPKAEDPPRRRRGRGGTSRGGATGGETSRGGAAKGRSGDGARQRARRAT